MGKKSSQQAPAARGDKRKRAAEPDAAAAAAPARPAKRPSLRDQLESLTNPAPVDFDPESFDMGDGTAAKLSAFSGSYGDESTSGKLGRAAAGRSLRSLAQEDDPRYAGRVVSRKVLASGSGHGSRGVADESEDSGARDADEQHDDDFDEQATMLLGELLGDSAQVAPRRPRGRESGRGRASDAATDEDGSDDDASNDDAGDATSDDASDGAEDSDDGTSSGEEATARDDRLQAQQDALLRQDDVSLMRVARDSVDEAEKAKHVRNQLALWDDFLELRIRLQSLLLAANRLPQLEDHHAFTTAAPNVGAAMQGASASVQQLLSRMLELRHDLMSRHTDLAAQQAVPKPSEPGAADRYWRVIQAGSERVRGFRDTVVNKWSRKVAIASGGGSFKAFNQSPLAQVEAVMQDKERLLRRCRTKRAQYKVFGQPARAQAAAAEEEGGAEVDVEVFDDADYYQQMLNEFLGTKSEVEGGTGSIEAALRLRQQRGKSTKSVDRKASKGRKLRFVVHPKLVGFMAPQRVPDPPVDVDELFGSLFR